MAINTKHESLEVRSKIRGLRLSFYNLTQPDQHSVVLKYGNSPKWTAFACAETARCRVEKDRFDGMSVWIGSAYFEIRDEDAARIAEFLGCDFVRQEQRA